MTTKLSTFPTTNARFSQAILIAAILAGAGYLVAVQSALPAATIAVAKASGPFLIGLYAACHARTLDGWLLVAVMLFCAVGDGLITSQVAIATLATAIAHMIATALYLRHRAWSITGLRNAARLAVVPTTVLVAWQLPIGIGSEDAIGTIAYAFFMSVMVATAWSSQFAKSSVGVGVTLFLVSDLLLFGIMGPLARTDALMALIWILYLAGQVLIATGVVKTLALGPDHQRKDGNINR
jgi:uncharacterized membrane protein YhhN